MTNEVFETPELKRVQPGKKSDANRTVRILQGCAANAAVRNSHRHGFGLFLKCHG
jgi:hypothetical protein